MNASIKMEVGIEDCLHIEFEYNKSKYAARSSRWMSMALFVFLCYWRAGITYRTS
jgi:hypothetical protein